MRRAAARVGQPGLRGFQRKGAWGPEAKTGASREGECLFFKVFLYSYSFECQGAWPGALHYNFIQVFFLSHFY